MLINYIKAMNKKITITQRELKNLDRKAKTGWAVYFKNEEINHQLHYENFQLLKKMKLMENNNDNQKLPENLVDEVRELYDVMKRKVECIICYEEMTSKDFIISSCNCKTKYCKTCYDKINECSVCKYKYKK